MNAPSSANIEPLVSRNIWRDTLRHSLRLYIGRGRRYSVKEASNGSGVPDRVIECAIAPLDSTDFRPLREEYLASLMKFLGADFAQPLMGLLGLGVFEIPEVSLPRPGQVAADAANDSAEIASMAADGEFDEDDCSRLRKVGEREIARGVQLVAMGSKVA